MLLFFCVFEPANQGQRTKYKMADEVAEKMKRVQNLIEKKNAIEGEIKELHEVLESQGGVGMKGNLVDNEDYPRQDIDVYAVRFARNRIICLQNDHKALMSEIEEGLHNVHAAAREKKLQDSHSQLANAAPGEESVTPFLYVDQISPRSPAEQAGLCVGDQVIKFGSINSENFQNMQAIGSVVQHSKGQSISVVVKRVENIQRLNLIPNEWSGRGLLGCNIITLDNSRPR
ncbi:26S proteasome non-ATPase regulatory subunit 9-like [Dendronephthya gigantea]|uniref:26S proteasome non-ATPase regulatory subunit 9-like n=1 Tax=Dendronephthya gigantea TaxID=151771 RepID=UPI00106A6F7A|nr:26S proteasome non-ATPase regulatory subunit 9-like [Dendronephthya gigantea]